jgi:hypothetical protein
MGMIVAMDRELGLTLSHSGGYPGYGSHVLLMPDRGVGVFAFANRTYAGPATAVWDATVSLLKAGALPPERPLVVSADLARAYAAAGRIYSSGGLAVARDVLAMNFLLDRDELGWSHDLMALRRDVGDCEVAAPITATGGLTGEFIWPCSHGRLKGSLELSPTNPPLIQQLMFQAVTP